MDRRQQKTRQAIFAAFRELLEQKRYNHITIQEIIDRANIGRSTFYAHFETKDALLRAMCTDIFRHVFSEELQQEQNHDFSAQDQGLEQKLTHIFYHLQENHKNLKGILSCESGELFMGYFKEYLSEIFSGYMDHGRLAAPKEYLLNHIVCSLGETVRWWITAHPALAPEEITRYFLSTMPMLLY